MVVPLAVTDLRAIDLPQRLCPLITIQNTTLMLVPFEAAHIDKRLLKIEVGSVQERLYEITAAMGAVISGI